MFMFKKKKKTFWLQKLRLNAGLVKCWTGQVRSGQDWSGQDKKGQERNKLLCYNLLKYYNRDKVILISYTAHDFVK